MERDRCFPDAASYGSAGIHRDDLDGGHQFLYGSSYRTAGNLYDDLECDLLGDQHRAYGDPGRGEFHMECDQRVYHFSDEYDQKHGLQYLEQCETGRFYDDHGNLQHDKGWL